MNFKKTLTGAALACAVLLPVWAAGPQWVRQAPESLTPPPPATTLCGIMVSNEDWKGDLTQAGVYTVEVKPDGAITCLHHSQDMAFTTGALMLNNIMYAVTATTDGFFYNKYSASDWSRKSREEIDIQNVPAGLTYDPATKKVYGGFWNVDENAYDRLCTFNLSTAEATMIPDERITRRDFHAMAAGNDGTVYALFGGFTYLATMNMANPKNINFEYLGHRTGMEVVSTASKGHVSSMTYDAANNRLLAIVYQEKESWNNGVKTSDIYSSLVEINPKTYETTEIRRMPGNACFAGIYVVESVTDPMAPNAPVALTVLPDAADATQGTVSFTVPTTTFGGAELTERVMAIVSVNGTETVHGYYEAGQEVQIPVVLTDGDNTVKVTLCTDALRGEPAEKTVFAGMDSPLPVTNVFVAVKDGTATLTWDAPAGGVKGGVIVPEDIRYTIIRYPDHKTVATDYGATTFRDANLPADARVIYYTVLAYNTISPAPAAVESNRVPAAGSFDVPFAEKFDTPDEFALWTVVDPNGKPTWTYDETDGAPVYRNPEGKVAGDDWLISPALNLRKDVTYKVRYEYRALSASYPETFEVKAGQGMKAADMKIAVDAHKDINNTKLTAAETSFKATEDGQWYLAFHYTSSMKQYGMVVDNITVSEFDGRVPDRIADLTITPGAEGALKATVSFTVPTKDAEGNDLTAVNKAELYREDLPATEPLHVFSDITPGQALKYEDTVEKAGTYTYNAKVYNVSEAGLAATAKTFVGEDMPAAPTDVTVSQADGKVTVSWTAPAIGDHGGWFNPEKLTYTIYRGVYTGTKLAEGLTATSYVDEAYRIPTDRQDAVAYTVLSYYDGKMSRAGITDATLVGAPYPAPATESFPQADMSFYPWIAQSDNAVAKTWTLETSGVSPVVADHSGDRGLACFNAVGEPAGVVSHFYSPMFDVSALAHPTLSFYMYHTPGTEGNGSMSVAVSKGGGEFVAVGEAIARTSGEADGWIRHTMALDAAKGATDLRVRFTGTGDGAANIFIDDITLADIANRDAAISAFTAPVRVATGVTFPVEIRIENVGIEALTGLTLTLKEGATVLTSKEGIAVAAGATETVVLTAEFATVGSHTLTATLSGDEVEANNTATATVKAVEPVVPTVSGLAATTSGGAVTLTWKAPHEAGAVTDDVEAYKDWAVDGIGEWTMFDGDYAPTVYIKTNQDAYPNASTAKAFQVCNANTLGIDVWEEGKTHSGNKMFMAIASVGYVNNDWLISPRLNGAKQWISFYARSFTTDGVDPERMKVWYSTTDTDPVNFKLLTDNYIELGGTWQQFRYFLPEGAKYFAVNCVSDDAFAMFVDDLSFNDMTVPAWTLTGYEVTCDGEKIATVTEPTYTHADGGGEYAVRPVFSEGNGNYCEPVKVEASGIGQLAGGITVGTAPGAIVVAGTDATVTVTNAAGMSFTAPAGTIGVAPGIYMVTVGDATVKVVVQ